MNYRIFLFILFIVLFQVELLSQEIKIEASNKPLSEVLVEIRESYDVDFSFDNLALSAYKITVFRKFNDIESALHYIFKDIPYQFEKISGVYVVFPKKKKPIKKKKPKIYSVSGRILEFNSNEVLPFSNIVINSNGIISDNNGNFIFRTTKDSVFRIQVSHLGYLIKDTIVYRAHKNLRIYLTPSEQQLKEIKVSDNIAAEFSSISNEVATIKLNHRITKYLPGSSDNSVFNLLRLQPGVLASGEQSTDLVIWGAYAGQSRVTFDGFTIFGLKNFNDNISSVNPLITKNIQLHKAGYDASYGDCVGGIVEISGKDGSTQKPRFHFGVNNLTVNSLVEIPFFKKSALQVAYRQTYYNLYKDGYNLFAPAGNNNNEISDISIFPDYSFKDLNVKYNFKDDYNFFYVSFLRGGDDFSYSIDKELPNRYADIVKTTIENNKQKGLAVFYERKVNERLNLSLLGSYSDLTSIQIDEFDVVSTISNQIINQREFNKANSIAESKVKLKLQYHTSKKHLIEINSQLIDNESVLEEDSVSIQTLYSKKNETYYTLGIKDVISLKNKQLNIGLRMNYLPYLNDLNIEPRLSFSHSLSKIFRYNLSWGIYNQYLVKSSVIDELGNYHYNWVIADNEIVPVLNSQHFVGGFSFNMRNLIVNFDGFYKTTAGLTRYFRFNQRPRQNSVPEIEEGVFIGDGYSYGLDFYTKYDLKGHTLWIAYTWSKSFDHFSYMRNNTYLYAPQDQRHEIKVASIINLAPVYLSANYVYGSGFLERPYAQMNDDGRIPYSRLDVSATYRFSGKSFAAETGISVLNVLNTKNKKFSNFEKIPLSQSSSASVYFEAMPFTPTVFLKLSF